MRDFISILREAQDPNTGGDRLWEIQGLDLSDLDSTDRSKLISALVDHPNADEDLCIELLKQWPCETLASTRLQLLLLADNEISWGDLFEDFSDTLPALEALTGIPRSHQFIIRLFETALLRHFDRLSCSFDWNMTCTHEISIDWNPSLINKQEENSTQEEYEETTQDFTITCSATIDSGNSAELNSPNSVSDIQRLYTELDACDGCESLFKVLRAHGWGCDTECTGDGGYFELESVEPELDDWEFSGSFMGDASGTLCITDPTGTEHECELPAGDIEDSFDNYRLDQYVSLSGLFDEGEVAQQAFRRIIGLIA